MKHREQTPGPAQTRAPASARVPRVTGGGGQVLDLAAASIRADPDVIRFYAGLGT